VPAVGRRLAQELSDATRPAPIAPLAQLAVLAALGPDTGLRLRAGLRVSLERQPDGLILRSMDQRIVLPAAAEAAMMLILTGDRLTPASLPLPAAQERLELARQLVRAAVLVPDDHG
nr:cupin [Actinomycetota bacterium]